MKMSTAITMIAVFVALATALVAGLRSRDSVLMVGHLPRAETAGILRAIQREVHPPILPNLSLDSLRGAPSRLLGRLPGRHPQVLIIERRTAGFVAAFGRRPPDVLGRTNILWSFFKETNGWRLARADEW